MTSKALTGHYGTSQPNQSVTLYEGDIQLDHQGRLIAGSGAIECRWLPAPRIYFSLDVAGYLASMPDQVTMRLQHPPSRVSGFVTGLETVFAKPGSGRSSLTGFLDPQTFGGGQLLSSLLFHVVNFVDFRGSSIETPTQTGTRNWAGRVAFEVDPWSVTLDSVPDSKELMKRLRGEGGYAITHVGRLERVDKSPFTAADAEANLHMLGYLLSFAAGRRIAVALPVGFDAAGQKAWEQWLHWTASPWMNVRSWFPPMNPSALESLASGFQQRWSSPDWNRVMYLAIEWYCQANSQSRAEAAIIAEQVGLELLAWAILVQDEGRLSQLGFEKRLPAHDQIRLLVTHMRAPTSTPQPVLTSLGSYAAREGSEENRDGPGILALIRNRIVHPPKRTSTPSIDPMVLYEASQLGLWYMELAILWFAKYSGEHTNRVSVKSAVAQTEPVPWS